MRPSRARRSVQWSPWHPFQTPTPRSQPPTTPRTGSTSVWTRDRDRGAEIARDIDCGTVNVNDAFLATWGAVDAPMGGFGDSGMGRRHGPEGIRRYVESRTIGVSRVGPLTFPDRIPIGWFVRGAFAALSLGGGRAAARRLKERIRLR